MTNKEINKTKRDLYDIQKRVAKTSHEQHLKDLKSLAEKVNAPIPWELFSGQEAENELIRNIHTTLQTEEMFNACVTSKRACWWAFLAAIVACISVILQNWPWFLSILFLLKGRLKL